MLYGVFFDKTKLEKDTEMKKCTYVGILMALVMLAFASTTYAQTSKNKVTIGYRAMFNAKMEFVTAGTSVTPVDMPNKDYDDGYVHNDPSRPDGLTRNWQYTSPDQIGNYDELRFHKTVFNRRDSGADSDWSHGVEMTFSREIVKTGPIHWGGVVGVGYNHMSDERTENNRRYESLTTDIYWATKWPIPPAPYKGSDAPGIDLKNDPAMIERHQDLTVAKYNGKREMDAHLITARIGPKATLFAGPVNVSIDAGVAVGVMRTSFSFEDSYQGAFVNQSESGSDSGWQAKWGPCAGLNLGVDLGKDWGLFADAHWYSLGEFGQKIGRHETRIDMRNAIMGTIGLSKGF